MATYNLPRKNAADYKDLHVLEDEQCVRMQVDYLKGWHIFDQNVDKLYQGIKNLVYDSANDLEGQIYGMRGLSAAKWEMPAEREFMYNNILRLYNEQPK